MDETNPPNVSFAVFVGGQPHSISDVPRDIPLNDLFDILAEQPGTSNVLSSFGADPIQCVLYRFREPVSIAGSTEEATRACSDESNWEFVKYSIRVKDLADAQHLTKDYVCLAIEICPSTVIAFLKNYHTDLFRCLQITLTDLNSWSQDDVFRNMEGGCLLMPNDNRTGEATMINQIESNLMQARPHEEDTVLSENNDSSALDSKVRRESAAFFGARRCYTENAQRLASSTSCALRASTFTASFILPPFFTCPPENGCYQFKLDAHFLHTAMDEGWCRSAPISDFTILSPIFSCPFVVSEVSSQRYPTDRWRMLAQAIAIARAGRFLLKSTSAMRFFVTAIYLRPNLTVERHIVMQTGPDRQVYIAEKDFDLTNLDEATKFLREMYNLADAIRSLTEDLEESKTDSLMGIYHCADLGSIRMMKSFDLGVYWDEEVRNCVRSMGYDFIAAYFGHEHIASVQNPSGQRGVVRYTENDTEVDILQRLLDFDAPDNHTVSARIRTTERGYILCMPVAGAHITSLKKNNARLWSAAKQLFEGVAFMHSHGVAHLDINPTNVLIPIRGGRLTIIDFSYAVFVGTPGATPRSFVRSQYVAPELRGENNDPIRADLWSCGRTLSELCLLCKPSPACDLLTDITGRLMRRDPLERPMLSDVLEQMVNFEATSSTSDLHANSPSS